MCCGKVLEGVQLWRNAALGEAGCTEIAEMHRDHLTEIDFCRDWSWKLSNIYNTIPGHMTAARLNQVDVSNDIQG